MYQISINNNIYTGYICGNIKTVILDDIVNKWKPIKLDLNSIYALAESLNETHKSFVYPDIHKEYHFFL